MALLEVAEVSVTAAELAPGDRVHGAGGAIVAEVRASHAYDGVTEIRLQGVAAVSFLWSDDYVTVQRPIGPGRRDVPALTEAEAERERWQ